MRRAERVLGDSDTVRIGDDLLSNLSRYVGNSPTNFIDPDGQRAIPFNLPRYPTNPFQQGVNVPRPGERGYVSDGNMADDLIDLGKRLNNFFIPSVANGELPPNLRRKVKIAPRTDFGNDGVYGPQDTRYGPPAPSDRRNNNPAVPRSPRRRRNLSNPNVNETITRDDVPPVTILDNPLNPSCPTILTTPKPPFVPPILGGIDLTDFIRDLIESFPGPLAGALELLIPFFRTWGDVPSGDLEEYGIPNKNTTDVDTVISGIANGHGWNQDGRSLEWKRLGISNQEQLAERLNDISNFPKDIQSITRVDSNGNQVKVTIYLGIDGTVLIVNPLDPDGGTAFNPNIQKNSTTASQEYFDSQKPTQGN